MTSIDKWLILYEERLAVPLMNHPTIKIENLTVKISSIENVSSVKVIEQGKRPAHVVQDCVSTDIDDLNLSFRPGQREFYPFPLLPTLQLAA